MKLVWNAIVKNEAARIERCMQSLIGHVDGAVIFDTGSTDGTPEIIETFFAKHGKRCMVVRGQKFVNFEQARNQALHYARGAPFDWDYAILCDADMELVVPGPMPQLTHAAYQVMQRASALEYFNARLVAYSSKAAYIGVTHEYLNVPEGTGTLPPSAMYFLDHADGANRTDKFTRDIALLKAALEKDPSNGRYWFYLGQSYRDAGMPREAVDCYEKRVELGGWDEEKWNAQLNVATCMKHYDESGFVDNTLKAYEMRPQRAEALYDLAKYYREGGKNNLAAMFAKQAMDTPRPADALFVNPFVYEVGAKEEYSIAAFYDPKTRAAGFRACDSVALGAHGYGASTQQARANLFHYLPRAHEVLPTFWSTQLQPRRLPAGWTLLNPSIVRRDKTLFCIVRTVNYEILADGSYAIKGVDGSITRDNPIRTRNFMCRLDAGLQVFDAREIKPPTDDKFPLVRGWEDMRLFWCDNRLMVSATVREANERGLCEQWTGTLSDDGEFWSVKDAARMPGHQDHEKNWMPVINGGPKFVYKLGTVVSPAGHLTARTCLVNTEHIRGGSQVIPFRSGYLGVVHEASYKPDGGYAQRYYWHRFVFFDIELNVQKVSLPFVFHDKQIEFCAGLCQHTDGKHLLLSYGIKDCEAWVAMVDANDVAEFTFQ